MSKDLLTSKKFQTAIISVIVVLAGEVGLNLDPDALIMIVSPLLTYIFAQGVADHGKEKAKVEQRGQTD